MAKKKAASTRTKAAEENQAKTQEIFDRYVKEAVETSNDGSLSSYEATETPEGVPSVVQHRGKR